MPFSLSQEFLVLNKYKSHASIGNVNYEQEIQNNLISHASIIIAPECIPGMLLLGFELAHNIAFLKYYLESMLSGCYFHLN